MTSNSVRARLVIIEWLRLASDAARTRAIVFRLSGAHAQLMTAWLNRAGLSAACAVGKTDREERRRTPQRLHSGELCALVTVDLYNEGVYSSGRHFAAVAAYAKPRAVEQRIGRGLRLASGKGGPPVRRWNLSATTVCEWLASTLATRSRLAKLSIVARTCVESLGLIAAGRQLANLRVSEHFAVGAQCLAQDLFAVGHEQQARPPSSAWQIRR